MVVEEKARITNVSGIYPLGSMTICTKFHFHVPSTAKNKHVTSRTCWHIPLPWFGRHRCTAGRQRGRGHWPHKDLHGRAAPGELEGGRGSSEGGSDCRESRCSERVEYRGDLEEEERKKFGRVTQRIGRH